MCRTIVVALFLGANFTRNVFVNGAGNIEEATVYCSQVTGSELFHHSPAFVRPNKDLAIDIFSTGHLKNCLLDKLHPIRIELERMFRVSDIGIRLTAIEGTPHVVTVNLLRDKSSNSVAKFPCAVYMVLESFAYYQCSDEKYVSHGVLVSAIEITSDKLVTITFGPPNLEWMYVIQKTYENHPAYEEQCLEPGFYPTQRLIESKKFKRLQASAEYCCLNEHGRCYAGKVLRNCTENGWSASPLRCLPSNSNYTSETRLESEQTITFYLNRDIFRISTIRIDFNLPCGEISQQTNQAQQQSSPSSKVKISIKTTSPPAVTWSQQYQQTKQFTLCWLNLNPSTNDGVDCHNCKIEVSLPDDWIKSTVMGVIVTGLNRTDYETYNWIKNGCPPIDPYVGMPDEYANEASRNMIQLNEQLRLRPCRNGYRINANSDRQCIGDSWLGNVPKCQLVTCRRPPSIQNGHWRYVNQPLLYDKVQYTCDGGFVFNHGDGIVECDYEKNEWVGRPSCVPDATTTDIPNRIENLLADPYLSFVLLASVAGLLLLGVVSFIALCMIRRMRNQETTRSTSATTFHYHKTTGDCRLSNVNEEDYVSPVAQKMYDDVTTPSLNRHLSTASRNDYLVPDERIYDEIRE